MTIAFVPGFVAASIIVAIVSMPSNRTDGCTPAAACSMMANASLGFSACSAYDCPGDCNQIEQSLMNGNKKRYCKCDQIGPDFYDCICITEFWYTADPPSWSYVCRRVNCPNPGACALDSGTFSFPEVGDVTVYWCTCP